MFMFIPSADKVTVPGVQLDSIADSPHSSGGYQCSSRAQKHIEHNVTDGGAVTYCPYGKCQRFYCGMVFVAMWLIAFPNCSFIIWPEPSGGLALLEGVKTRFVAMLVLSVEASREPVLDPDQEIAKLPAGIRERRHYGRDVDGGEPQVERALAV